ncbi:MAG: helix-turn-helix domain-containing protein [Synergistaceae bacterium]|nr:helix-turn-helix domain-containing protein [Synergistaceae bacterium]
MNRILGHNTYTVELKPTLEQIQQIERTMGVCRYVYNLFIATNRDNYRDGTHCYMSGYDFSKWLNNDYRKGNPGKLWIW